MSTDRKTEKDAEPTPPPAAPLADRPIVNPNAALIDRRGDPEPPVRRARPTPVAHAANPHASPVSTAPVDGEEALADPTPIAVQGEEVIWQAPELEGPDMTPVAPPPEPAARNTRTTTKKDDDDDDDDVSGGEKARRAARKS